MYNTSDIRNGLKIELNGAPYEVLDFLHSKSGRGGAHVWTKLRNLLNGSVMENTFRSGEKIAKPDIETKEMQYIYKEGQFLVFMDLTTYEQIEIPEENLSGKGGFLIEGMEIKSVLYKGQVIDLILPPSVILVVKDTEPGVKGDTVSGATKPAQLESGLTISVPLFIEVGDKIKVDTRTGQYLGRE